MEINSSFVSQLVATQFPAWAHLPIKPVARSGWDNRTFLLGDELTVRLPSEAAYEPQVKKEQQWLPRLAPHLPLNIPTPLAMGMPTDEFPLHWSIYRWIDGEDAAAESINNMNEFAIELAHFLNALQRIDATDGPVAGSHNFYRGGPVATYDEETRNVITYLDGKIDIAAATEVWESALEAAWSGPPVWVHGDVHATNLLIRNGRLCAVIDFGCLGVGDPACDLTIAWTLFTGSSRELFRSHLQVDEAAWLRARGWALWKAMITIANPTDATPDRLSESHRVLADLFAEIENR